MHPDYPEFAAAAARMLDDELCAAIGVADAEPTRFHLDEGQQAAFVAAMSAEVVLRLGPAGRRVVRPEQALPVSAPTSGVRRGGRGGSGARWSRAAGSLTHSRSIPSPTG